MDRSLKARLLEAVDLALAGDWQAAHLSSRRTTRASGSPTGSMRSCTAWKETQGNASYWYRRCGRASVEPQPTDVELRQIRDELNGG